MYDLYKLLDHNARKFIATGDCLETVVRQAKEPGNYIVYELSNDGNECVDFTPIEEFTI
jgi:hypothetical protein